MVLPRSTTVLTGLMLLICLIMTGLPEPVEAAGSESMTLRLMMVKLTNIGYVRYSGATVEVSVNGSLQETINITDGLIEVTIPRSGETVLTFPPSADYDWFYFYINFTDPETYTCLAKNSLFDPEPKDIAIVPNPTGDGTFMFDYHYRLIAFFEPPANTSCPIMGFLTDPYGGQRMQPIFWSPSDFDGVESEAAWFYGEPEDQMVSLRIDWQTPSGEITSEIFPHYSITESASGVITITEIGPRNWDVGNYPYKLIRIFPWPFMHQLEFGTHWVTYYLVDPDGNLSNRRVQSVTVLDWPE